ncbi:MAG: type IV pili twitching motility protein PilT, partial [Paraglaciecola sp.]|nr:type IV pili twitching motility protein PilT [Paraglaciecola sp.]
MDFLDLLRTIVKEDGSDLYFSTGAPPSMKVLGKLSPITDKPYGKGEIKDIAYDIMDEGQINEFEQ